MGTTTFSGPIKAGTIKHTTGSTLGTDMANVGQVVMSQTFAADLSGGALAAQVTDVIIPANSQIIDCVIDVITAASRSYKHKCWRHCGRGRYFSKCICYRYDRGSQIPNHSIWWCISMGRHRSSGTFV